MNECLDYFLNAIEHPEAAIPWRIWWDSNVEVVRSRFSRSDYLRLKFHKLEAAREILVREGRMSPESVADQSWDRTYCRTCGEKLFEAIPGKTTSDEIVEFGLRAKLEEVIRGRWIHPGIYCVNGCTEMMFHYRRPSASEND